MIRHKSKLQKLEKELQPKKPPKIVIICPWEEPPPTEEGDVRIILTWDDDLPEAMTP